MFVPKQGKMSGYEKGDLLLVHHYLRLVVRFGGVEEGNVSLRRRGEENHQVVEGW